MKCTECGGTLNGSELSFFGVHGFCIPMHIKRLRKAYKQYTELKTHTRVIRKEESPSAVK